MNQQGGERAQRQRRTKAPIQTPALPKDRPLPTHDDSEDNRSGYDLIGFERTETEMHVGPLPHPEIFRRYEEILPGAAERLFQQFEEEGRTRREIGKQLANNDVFLSRVGLIGGIILGLAMIFAGYKIAQINPWAGSAIIGTGMAAVLAAYFRGVQRRHDSSPETGEDTKAKRKAK